MGVSNSVGPIISIDFRKFRIRISKQTLHLIGDPDYIQLLIHPEKHSIAIQRVDGKDHLVHRVKWAELVNKKSFELYSTNLLRRFLTVCPELSGDCTYRFYGEIVSEKAIARFSTQNAELISACTSVGGGQNE